MILWICSLVWLCNWMFCSIKQILSDKSSSETPIVEGTAAYSDCGSNCCGGCCGGGGGGWCTGGCSTTGGGSWIAAGCSTMILIGSGAGAGAGGVSSWGSFGASVGGNVTVTFVCGGSFSFFFFFFFDFFDFFFFFLSLFFSARSLFRFSRRRSSLISSSTTSWI